MEKELQLNISEALKKKAVPSLEFENRLFAKAEDLLVQRREQVAKRKLEQSLFQKIFGKTGAIQFLSNSVSVNFCVEVARFLTLYPSAQALTLLLLFTTFALLHLRPEGHKLSFRDLPNFPKINNASAQCEAQWLAERLAYEKEVQDDIRKLSQGG